MSSRGTGTAEAGSARRDASRAADAGASSRDSGAVTEAGQDAGRVAVEDAAAPRETGTGAPRDAAATHDAGITPTDATSRGAGTPEVQYVGRFETSDPAGPWMGWPGTEVVAQFDGTAATVQLTQDDGYSGGPSWFDVVIDGAAGTPFSLEGTGVVVPIASGLAPGHHVLVLEKRTEANLGTVRFEGFTFTGGSGLLAPPARAPHRIELLSDSTIDGFGVLGNINTTCTTGDPPQYNDSRSSMAFFTASALNAERVLAAYSGKGIAVDEDPADTEYFPILYPRSLPDDSSAAWTFTEAIPDAVVFSLGGVDMDGLSTAPPGFQAAYDALVGTVRGHYPSAAIWLTVWSQITNEPVATRTALTSTLQAIVSARIAHGDDNLFLYVFPEATADDQTGCEGHATVAHSQAMAALMAAEIQQQLKW